MAVTVATIPPSYHDGDVPPVDEDRRIEEELRRRERAAPRDPPSAPRGGVSGMAPREPDSRTPPSAATAQPPLNREDLRRLLAETEGRLAAGIDAVAERALPTSEILKEIRDHDAREGRVADNAADPPLNREDLRRLLAETEGRLAAGIDAAAERALPASEALKEIRDRAAREGRVADNVADLQESLRKEIASRTRGRTGRRAFLRRAVLALAVAATATASLYAGALLQRDQEVLETADPSNGWRDYLWDRYGPELRDCVVAARRAGRTMRCEIVNPLP